MSARIQKVPALFAFVGLLLLQACASGEGGVCQVDSDCSGGLVCCKSSSASTLASRGVCLPQGMTCTTSTVDTGIPDTGAADSGRDSSAVDSSGDAMMSVDTGAVDTGTNDAGSDASIGDTSVSDAADAN